MRRNVIDVNGFIEYLKENEKSKATIDKYASDIVKFRDWIEERGMKLPFATTESAKRVAIDYKEYLKHSGIKPASVNVKLASINAYYKYKNYHTSIRYLRIQRRIFTDRSRELSLIEYRRLVEEALNQGNYKLALIMETMAATGMRVSELQYITAESILNDKVQVDLKNKIRTIFLPDRLRSKLCQYALDNDIDEGELFRTNRGTPMTRRQIWQEMQEVSRGAGVARTKVFPHNMRHVFARTYYQKCKDIARLADVLGHSSLETTRVYIMDSGSELERQINNLGIVS
ncbi:MAG: tyrosine-type recombinase/integrase [Clostridiales bacterium]|nr:tyrosine-type recombinase/integrase [Candidatus Crickella equi]